MMPRFFRGTVAFIALLALGLTASGSARPHDEPPAPEYQGRAIFQPLTHPLVPERFHGDWIDNSLACSRWTPGDVLVVASDRVVLFGNSRRIERVLIRPGQEQPAGDVILEVSESSKAVEVLILSQGSEGELTLRQRGMETVRKLRRCGVRGVP